MNTKQIVVLAVVLLFILSSFFIGGGFVFNLPTSGGENITGEMNFNGTIRTYDPVLFIQTNDTLSGIENLDGVKTISPQSGYYIVNLETRDDVFPVAEKIRSLGFRPIARANVLAPNNLTLLFGTNVFNISHLGGSILVVTEPVIDSGEIVEVSMIGVTRNNVLIDYQNAFIVFREMNLTLNTSINSNYTIYTYIVPWSERNQINEENYNRSDLILFNPISTVDVLSKKTLPYVIYVDSKSAVINANFTNETKIIEDFGNVTFTDSTFQSRTPLNLTYENSTKHVYNISLVSNVHLLPINSYLIETKEHLNESLILPARAITSGEKIVSIRPS